MAPSHPSRAPSRRWRINLLLLVVSLMAGLALCEGVLSLLGLPEEHRAHPDPPQFQPEPDKDYLYINLPSADIRYVYDSNPRGYFLPDGSVDQTTNSWGFRVPEFGIAKPPGTLRFLFLGDSFTFGEGVRDSDTYPEQFRAMAEKEDAYPGRRIEAINLGVGGYNTEQEAALLRDFGLSLSPDRIILGYCLNDAEPTLFRHAAGGTLVRRHREADVPENLGTAAVPFPLSLLRSTRLVYLSLEGRRLTERTIAHYRSLYRDGGEDWARTRRSLSDIARMGRERGMKVTVAIFPVFFRLNRGYPFLDIHRKVAKAVEEEGMEALDLYPLFSRFSGPELWVHPTDQHPNEVAHRRVAAALLEFVKAGERGEGARSP